VHREAGLSQLNYSSATSSLAIEMRFERRMGRFIAVSMVLWVMQLSTAAHAQSLRLALFKTASSSSELSPLAAALDPVLQAEIGRMPQLSIAALPPLDLASLQLALDCVGETASCLAVAAERSKVDGLVSPSLARSGAAVVLSLLLYNPQQSSAIRIVTRNFAGNASEVVVLDGAKILVQELFAQAAAQAPPPAAAPEPEPELPAPAATPEPAATTQTELQPPEASPSSGSPSQLLPIALGAGGLAVIAIGIGFGAASSGTETSYANTRVVNSADAQHATELLSTARTQATIANVALVLGAAGCVAGGVVYFLQRNRRPDTGPNAHLALGPGYLGITGGF
jgi:hypothetical protein